MLKRIKELLKDISLYGFSQVLSQAISFFLLPLYTQYLTPQDYGVLALLGIITSFFGPLSLLGINGALFRYVGGEKLSEHEEKIYISNAFIMVTINTLLLLAAGVASSSFLSEITFDTNNYTHLVRLSLLAGAIGSLTSIPLAVLRVKRKVKGIVILNTIGLVINITLTIYFVAFLKRGLLGAIEASIISNSLNLLPLLYLFKEISLKHIMWEKCKHLLSYGLPNVPHHLMGLTFSFYTSFSLNRLASTQELGLYSMAQKFTLPFSLLMNSVQSSWNAYRFEILRNEENARLTFRKFNRYLIAVYLIAFSLTACFGGYLLKVVTSKDYYDSAQYICFLAFLVFTNAMYFVYGTGLAFGKNQKFAPIMSFMGLLTVVLSSKLLIDAYGAKGAAVSNALGHIMMTIMVYFISEKLYNIGYNFYFFIEACLLTFGIALISIKINDLSSILELSINISLFIAVVVYIKYRLITRSEVNIGISVLKTKYLSLKNT